MNRTSSRLISRKALWGGKGVVHNERLLFERRWGKGALAKEIIFMPSFLGKRD